MTVPPFELTLEEYQLIREALAQAEGALTMTATLTDNHRSVINPDGARNVAARCHDALGVLGWAWERREASPTSSPC